MPIREIWPSCGSSAIVIALRGPPYPDLLCESVRRGSPRPAAHFQRGVSRLLDLMSEPSCLTVMGNRPLLYVFRMDERWVDARGGAESARRLFDGFRESVRATGCGDPYIVAMNDTVSQGEAILNTIGAVSAYALAGDGRSAAPFTDLASRPRSFWDEAAERGLAVVPLAMSGWDRRPRVERPVAWERAWQQPMAALDRYYALPTPEEPADHIDSALLWTALHPECSPGQVTLTYAWNEHDGGGWLCPTLGADGQPDASRLGAIARMLEERWGE